MNTFLIVKADGSHAVVAAEKINDVTEKILGSLLGSVKSGRMPKYVLDRWVKVSIWNHLDEHVSFGLTEEETEQELKTECQFILDHYDDVYGLHFVNDIAPGASTADLQIEFLNEEEVCRLMKEVA